MKRTLALIASDRGLQGVLARLDSANANVEMLEQHLRAAKRERAVLVAKALAAGMSTREVGARIGKQSASVVFMRRQADAVTRET